MRHGLLLLAAACVSGQAQTANFIEVYADQSQVLVGRTLQVNAVVRDVNGVAIPDAAVTWSVNQAAATISGTGLVTAKGLATVRVTARSGGASGEAALQCIPSKVEVTPGATAVDVGVFVRKDLAIVCDGMGAEFERRGSASEMRNAARRHHLERAVVPVHQAVGQAAQRGVEVELAVVRAPDHRLFRAQCPVAAGLAQGRVDLVDFVSFRRRSRNR